MQWLGLFERKMWQIKIANLPISGSSANQQKKYLFGSEKVIEYNDLSSFVTQIGDGNGIYISGTGDGNKYNTHILQNNIYNTAIYCGFKNIYFSEANTAFATANF